MSPEEHMSIVDEDARPVELRAGTARVDLYPSAGGRIGQISLDGRPLLRGLEHAWRGWGGWGSYPMVPWTNRIVGGVVRFGGETITMPINWPDGTAIHGLVAERPWRVDSSDSAAATLSVEVDVDRYHVGARQTFELAPDHLDFEIELVNLAAWRVPVGIGIHPWFLVGPVRVPAEQIWDGPGPMPEGPPRPVRPDEDLRTKRLAPPMDRCFCGLTDTSAEIGDLTLSWSGPITQVVVFSGDPDAVCVEPVTMANDGIRLAEDGSVGTGVLVLDPGSRVLVEYRISWDDL